MPNLPDIDATGRVPARAEGKEAANPICARDETPSPAPPSPSLRWREPGDRTSLALRGAEEAAIELRKINQKERARPWDELLKRSERTEEGGDGPNRLAQPMRGESDWVDDGVKPSAHRARPPDANKGE